MPAEADLGMEIDQQMQADPPVPERQANELQTLYTVTFKVGFLI
jgi:hypothetical protein